MRKNTVVKNTDMDEEMQYEAIDYAHKALEKFTTEKEIASYIKNKFDKNYGPTWNCICGRSFGSYVTHERNHFIYFYIGRVAFLLFRAPDKNNNNNYYYC